MPKKQAPKTERPSPKADDLKYLATPERKVSKSANFVSLYANDIQLATSPWDVKMTFGEVGDVELNDKGVFLHVQQIAEIRLSVQIAKRLLPLLAAQIELYEATVGPVPQPKE